MDNIIENLMCYLNERKTRHFLTNPKHLPCCNKIFCDQCILETLNTHVQPVLYHCSFCDSKTKIELNYDEQNRAVECKLKPANEANKALEKHLIDINDFLINKLEISLKNTEGLINNLIKFFNYSFINHLNFNKKRAIRFQRDFS